jgi:hypothetical protein
MDFDQAGGWISTVASPPAERDRFTLASALGTQQATFQADGQVSFSNYFWKQVLNGANLRDAYRTAETSMRFAGAGQEASFDDNGNGFADEPLEGNHMKRHRIGAGIQLAGNDPVVGTSADVLTLSGSNSTTVQVDNVTSTGSAAIQVTATLTPPYPTFLASPPAVPMTDLGGGSYSVTLDGFEYFGPYIVSAVPRDTEGNVGLPVQTIVKRIDAADIFESDDVFTTGTWIGLDGTKQLHGFHTGGDEDWVAFAAAQNESVTIETSGLGSTADTVVTLYDVDGTTILASDDNGSPYEANASLVIYTLPADGVYYVRVTQGALATAGADSEYTIGVYREVAPVLSPGQVGGLVKVAGSLIDVPESGLNIMLQGTDCSGVDQNCYVQSDEPHISVQPDGRVYSFALDTGPYEVNVSAPGFQPAMLAGTLEAGSALELSFELTDSSGQNAADLRNGFGNLDANGNGGLSLSESGLGSTMFNVLDRDSNGSITLAELIEATVGPVGVTDPVYVDFAYTGDETGTAGQPFDTLAEAAAFVAPAGTVILEPGATTETGLFNTPMTLSANGGAVTIGGN